MVRSKGGILVVVAGLAVLLALAFAFWRTGWGAAELLQGFLDWVRAGAAWLERLGPLGYYSGTALLATVGAPVSLLLVAGGAAFGAGWGLAGGLLALAASASLAHLLSRYFLEAPLRNLLRRKGRSIPRVTPDSERMFALVMRVTPGLPFVVQNYVLALGGVRLSVNIACLLPVQLLYVSGFVFLGDAFSRGNWGRALAGVCLLVVAGLVVYWIRKKNIHGNQKNGEA